jgi:hypothetical protein
MVKKIQLILIIVVLPLFLVSCYSFSGASIAPEVKTIAISYFPNRAPNVQPTLSSVFTEGLKDRFVTQTNLELVNRNGDLTFEGAITGYQVSAQAYQGNETAALNRLTITINVSFVNRLQPEMNFESSFSRYADFESTQSLAAVESALIEEIVAQLTEDVFNKALVNW